VEYDGAVKKGQVKEVIFWNTSIALYRGEDGELAAMQNRCAHRQLKLSKGAVDKCSLRCAYHGWAYNREGWLEDYSTTALVTRSSRNCGLIQCKFAMA
jgi:phenylpropionate dioxygenase-like ring-hydroxylating dioxygenase large terminal subunit